MAGLTEEGLIIETFESIRAQIRARLRTEFGAGLPLDESTIEGQSWDILIEALTKVWELLETFYSSLDPDKATEAALDALCLLTGTFRKPPSFGVGFNILTGDPATVVPAGQDVRIGADGAVATTYEDATLEAADAWDTGTSYNIGDIVTNDDNVYYCRAPADNTIDPPTHTQRYPAGTIFLITDPAGFWVWVGPGTAFAVDVKSVATQTGPVNFPSFAIDEIVTPLIGLSGVGNVLDFELGRDLQSDESLRESREANLSAPGTSTRDAIRAALLDLDGVVSVTMFVNNGNVVDGDGVPPHTIEALVRGGEDQDIFDCLLANVADGIGTYGNTSGTAFDSEGTEQDFSFSRPDEIEIYERLFLTKSAADYPDDGDDQVIAAIVAFGGDQDTGKDAVPQSIGAQANGVDGVIEVTDSRAYTDAIEVGTAWAPTTGYVATPGSRDVVTNNGNAYICITSGTSAGATGPVGKGTDITDGTVHWWYLGNPIPISKRQLAVFDTSRVAVTSTDAEP